MGWVFVRTGSNESKFVYLLKKIQMNKVLLDRNIMITNNKSDFKNVIQGVCIPEEFLNLEILN